MRVKVAIDTSVLVGLINSYDLWRNQAFAEDRKKVYYGQLIKTIGDKP